MKKAFLGIFTLLCLTGNLGWAMEENAQPNDTITFEPNSDAGLNPLAMTATKSPRSESLYRLNAGDRSIYTTDHPFNFVSKYKDNPLQNPEIGFVVYDNTSEQYCIMPLEFTYGIPSNKHEIAITTAKLPEKIVNKIEKPFTHEIAIATDNCFTTDATTSTDPLPLPKTISPFIKFPIVAFALYGGYEAIQKGTTWYKNNRISVQEKTAPSLQKLKNNFIIFKP